MEKAIYASSFKPAETYFPLVWDENIRYVHAENVTDRYLDLYRKHADNIMNDGNHVIVKVMMFKSPKAVTNSDDRVATNVDVFWGSEQQGGGRTANATQDMNDTLEFILEKTGLILLNMQIRTEKKKK
ncbi:MAG: hypothetical protein LIO65_01330 [Odoribacter sp.]|nr:hypothetical protein [Odoribacter sp.]